VLNFLKLSGLFSMYGASPMKKLFYVLTAISLVAGVSAFAVDAPKKIEQKMEKKADKKAEETAMKMEEEAPAAMEGKASEETETPEVITEETATEGEGEKAMDAKAPSKE
jgi:hypothetical protein